MRAVTDHLILSSQVLGYYNRRGINPEAFLNEIKYIASDPDDKHFFNVTDESALKDIVDALGERIFSLEGCARDSFCSSETEKRRPQCALKRDSLKNAADGHKLSFCFQKTFKLLNY